jgi:CRP-like cAMP-binding protein
MPAPPQDLDFAVLLRNAGFKKTIDYKARDVIFSQGAVGDSLFYVERGTVKLTVTSALGKEAIIALVDGGHLLGEACISSNLPLRMHSAVALTRTQALKIERLPMLDILHKDKHLSLGFIAYLAERCEHVNQDLASSLVQSSEERLYRALLGLAELSAKSDLRLPSGVTQQALADMIGSTRQRVNLLLKRFKQAAPVQGPKEKTSV